MFLDGLIYASVARNMAEGIGSFWHPQFSATCLNPFYEHPPLAIGIQSVLFKIFGDHLWVERLYSLFTFLLTSLLIVGIWKQITNTYKFSWLPVLLWTITSRVSWAVANNLLENTMTVFVCLALLFLLKSTQRKKYWYLFFAGISIALAFLSKGLLCLYLWSFPFFYYIVFQKITFLKMFYQSIVLILSTLMPIALLYFLNADAKMNLLAYFDHQVLSSIQNVQTVNTRLAIVGMFFNSIILPTVLIVLLLTYFKYKKHMKMQLLKQHQKMFLFFLLLIFAGVLPIMISLKQRAFYILTVYPIYAIGVSYAIYPLLKNYSTLQKHFQKWQQRVKYVSLSLFLLALVLSFIQSRQINRDQEKIELVQELKTLIGEGASINICKSMRKNWSLHAYFARYAHISLDASTQQRTYFLLDKTCEHNVDTSAYNKIALQNNNYSLFNLKH